MEFAGDDGVGGSPGAGRGGDEVADIFGIEFALSVREEPVTSVNVERHFDEDTDLYFYLRWTRTPTQGQPYIRFQG